MDDRTNKKEKPMYIGCATKILCALLFILLIPIIGEMKKDDEAEYSSEMVAGDKAYVDIVNCKPKYIISYGNDGEPERIFCECQLDHKGNVLVIMPTSFYGEIAKQGSATSETKEWALSQYPTVLLSEPFRLHCRVSLYSGLREQYGTGRVLELRDNNEND